MSRVRVLLVLAGVLSTVPDATAQVLGTFRWNTAPYCNVLVVTVTAVPGGIYTVDGFDEQCGGNPRQSVRGMALPQANGTVTFGLTVVTSPGGPDAVALRASILLSDLSGGWSDSAGHSGTLVFNPLTVSGGPRTGPVAPTSLPSSIVVTPNGNFFAVKGAGDDPLNVSGPGVRMAFWAARGAFRSGIATGSQWDEGSIGLYSTAMGYAPVAAGAYSVALGFEVNAAANFTTALGTRAIAQHTGSFALGDQSTASAEVLSSTANQFNARFSGGYRLFTGNTGNPRPGAVLPSGGSSWSANSDVRMKENFKALDGDVVLARIAEMPIQEWSYITQDASIRHAGPTAQDFWAAFSLGEDPLKINTIDMDGITLRAVQALEARDRREMEALRARIVELERLVATLVAERR